MLWREAYRTRAARDVPRPALVGESLSGSPFSFKQGALVMGFAPASFRQRALWLRLIGGEFPDPPPLAAGVALAAWRDADRSALEATTPNSAWGFTFRWDDPEDLWKTLAAPRDAEEVLAAVVDADMIRLALMGPPTEEALDAFAAALRAL
jgi:hypothetical protein